MKKMVMFILALGLMGLTQVAVEAKMKCYTHTKKWHACPVQPTKD